MASNPVISSGNTVSDQGSAARTGEEHPPNCSAPSPQTTRLGPSTSGSRDARLITLARLLGRIAARELLSAETARIPDPPTETL